jgi:methionyl-tRNA synthetase
MSEPLFLTTPLYYVNARTHLGHAYTSLLGDSLARYHRQQGRDTVFLTGTDEHGEKIQQSAAKQGKKPLDFATEIAETFRQAWDTLGINADIFYRTTRPDHYKLVSTALQRLKDKGDIHFATYKGNYCVGCERFRTDREWDEKGLCPDHQTPAEVREESNYFFKMSKYQAQLVEFYKSHPDSIVPSHYMKEALAMLEEPLEDLSISRPKTRIEWGIPLPFDDKFVTYVWFDALLNYPGGLGYQGHDLAQEKSFGIDHWKNATHLIGKDILKTHAVYWPTMLMALGLPLFRHLQVNGFWLSSGQKMSKSLGNVVDPLEIHARFGSEFLRYYLLRDMSYGVDATFTWEAFLNRSNAELANGIGNLASRTLTLVHKNLDAKVPSKAARNEQDHAFLARVHKLPEAFRNDFETYRFHSGLAAFAETVAETDRYINEMKPWALAKDPTQKERLGAVLGTAMDALACLSVVMASALPEGSAKLRKALGINETAVPLWTEALKTLPEGQALSEIPRLYPRLELPKDEPATK